MRLAILLVALLVVGCGNVRPEDTEAWVGQPVTALDKQPVFLTMPVVRTQAADGTEIRNYVNGVNVSSCMGGGTGMLLTGGSVPIATFNAFNGCVSRQKACNNIFYIRDDKVERYTPVGSGGARCMTDARLQPSFSGSTNLR